MGWEKIFAGHIFDKGLISKINNEHILLNTRKKNLIKTWAGDFYRHFCEEHIRMARK